jgi:chromate transporter
VGRLLSPEGQGSVTAESKPEERGTSREVGLTFLRLGLISFGGPLAQVAIMREELVRRRGWLSDAAFLDLVAATNLLPGPNGTELAIHLGARRAGVRGLFAAGLAFIVPAAVLVGVLAWLYVSYGSTPTLQSVLGGIKPVAIGIVVAALAGLGRRMLDRPALILLALGAAAVYLVGVNELLILAVGAAVPVLLALPAASRAGSPAAVFMPLALGAAAAVPVTLWGIAAVFLKIGAVLFGSGYVLLAFLRADLVERLGWLTDQQLLDAIIAGQVTPGPLFTTATFVGYLLAGPAGAIVATIAIFTPAFVFAGLLGPLVGWLRRHELASHALDGLNAASLGLMGGVAVLLGGAALSGPTGEPFDPWWAVAMVLATVLAITGRAGPTLLVAAGAGVGLVRWLVA